jgi:phosphatidate phosphatase APP1
MGQLAKGHPNLPTVYLSTGPWNVAPTLERFLTRHGFPKGPFLLTDWGATPDRAFRSGREHKVGSLERLANDFPNIEWVLIGDDGQHDETIYGDFSRSHPGKVRAVAIRQLSTPEAVLAGAPSMHPSPSSETVWVTGHTGTEIADCAQARRRALGRFIVAV